MLSVRSPASRHERPFTFPDLATSDGLQMSLKMQYLRECKIYDHSQQPQVEYLQLLTIRTRLVQAATRG